jgi:hypothetical protein
VSASTVAHPSRTISATDSLAKDFIGSAIRQLSHGWRWAVALNLGGIIRLTYAVKNDLGAATNPSAATLTIAQPDGTLANPSVTVPPVTLGLLVVDFTPAQVGLHSVHWATTGPTTAEDDMFVAERAAGLLISVDEAIANLRATGQISSDPDREQMQWLCLVASDAVERDLGRIIVRRTVVETYDGGRDTIALRSTPAISITTVTESGTSLVSTDWLLDAKAGFLYRGTASILSWAWGRQNIVVTYVAGYADPPRAVRAVALALVQALWQESQVAAHPLLDESGLEVPIVSAISGLPAPLRQAYESLRAAGVA